MKCECQSEKYIEHKEKYKLKTTGKILSKRIKCKFEISFKKNSDKIYTFSKQSILIHNNHFLKKNGIPNYD